MKEEYAGSALGADGEREEVFREHLCVRLDRFASHRLLALNAPPGYGKSTLVRQWLSSRSIAHAWVDLELLDSRLLRFWNKVLSALQTVGFCGNTERLPADPLPFDELPGMTPRASQSDTDLVEDLMTQIVNEFVQSMTDEARHFVIVLNGYQRISSADVHRSLGFLLDYLPDGCQLCICSNSIPFLHEQRRSGFKVGVLNSQDLICQPEEAQQLMRSSLPAPLADVRLEDVRRLCDSTDGWFYGLRRIASQLVGGESLHAVMEALEAEDVTAHWSSSYFVEGVFNKQPPRVQHLLLCCAFLPRANAELCRVLMEPRGDALFITQSSSTRLFLLPLEGELGWYRLHTLFATVLRRYAQQNAVAELLDELLGRAVEWYRQEGLNNEAVVLATRAKQYQKAADIILELASDMLSKGQRHALHEWIKELPYGYVVERCDLLFAYYWSLSDADRLRAGEELLLTLESTLVSSEAGLSEREQERYEVDLLVCKATLARLNCQSKSLVLSNSAANIACVKRVRSAWAVLGLGCDYYNSGRMDAAQRQLSRALRYAQARCDLPAMILCADYLSRVQIQRGRLRELKGVISSIRLWFETQTSVPSGYAQWIEALSIQADLCMGHTGSIEQRLQALLAFLEQPSEEDFSRLRIFGGYLRYQWALSQARVAEAKQSLVVMSQYMNRSNAHHLQTLPSLEALSAAIDLACGDAKAAEAWLKTDNLPGASDDYRRQTVFHDEAERLMMARAAVSTQRHQRALDIIKVIDNDANRKERYAHAMEAKIILALVHHRRQSENDIKLALQAFSEVLRFVDATQHMMLILSHGLPIMPLIELASERAIMPLLCTQLIELMSPLVKLRNADELKAAGLSRRELEVLQSLSEGLMDKEIASRLNISLSTVKTHARSLYSKLNVKNRNQAIVKAQASGVITIPKVALSAESNE